MSPSNRVHLACLGVPCAFLQHGVGVSFTAPPYSYVTNTTSCLASCALKCYKVLQICTNNAILTLHYATPA